jgi:3-phytase
MRTRRRIPVSASLVVVAASLALGGTILQPVTSSWEGAVVTAVAQTAPAYGAGDTADDPAIWIHPRDPALSLVIGTNKRDPGGLQVFDLDGEERQFVRSGQLNNVDLRDGFPFPGAVGTLVAASNRSDDTIELFRLDPVTRSLEPVASARLELEAVYGFCLYRSQRSGRFYAFVTSEEGSVRQYELVGSDGITVREVRRWELRSEAEGCVADDEHGALYLSQEARGIWKLPAEPDEEATLELLGETSPDVPPLVPDVEGVTIYDAGAGEGYLIVSSQGSSTFATYSRKAPHSYLGSFTVGGGVGVDGASNTDGIAVTSVPVDDRFPAGLLVVHDQHNRGAASSNFKYVSWTDVARVLGLDLAAAD